VPDADVPGGGSATKELPGRAVVAAPADAGPPGPEVVAAIVAAVEAAWPRPAPPPPPRPARPTRAWRWSGRWWGPYHVVADRRRPF
jgi:hypothetical protein